jgi:HSP20 family protein
MELTIYRPLREIVPFRGIFDYIFDDEFFSPFERFLYPRFSFMPPVDIKESDDEICLIAEVPGMTEKDIEVEVKDHTLIIRGEKRLEEKGEDKRYRRFESYRGTFERAFTLPEGVDIEKIKGRLSNGILEIQIPKGEKAQTKKIPINVN